MLVASLGASVFLCLPGGNKFAMDAPVLSHWISDHTGGLWCIGFGSNVPTFGGFCSLRDRVPDVVEMRAVE